MSNHYWNQVERKISMMDKEHLSVTMTGRDDSERRDAVVDAEVGGGLALGAWEGGRDGEELSVDVMLSEVLEKADLLAAYSLMCELLLALNRPRLTIHKIFEWLTALARRMGRIGMVSYRWDVVVIKAPEGGGDTGGTTDRDQMPEMLGEAQAIRGRAAIALGMNPGQSERSAGLKQGSSAGGASGRV